MRSLFFAGMLFGGYVFATTFGGQIEGTLFPVVDRTQITRTEPVSEVSTRFWGEFRKTRDCQFDSIEFYVGEPGKSARVDFRFEEGSKVRSDGFEVFGPWVVQLTQDQIRERSYSVVWHRCHALWLTRTRFY